jgi:hypothetical protein
VFGVALALCQRAKTIDMDNPDRVAFDASYGFYLPMDRGKTAFLVEEPGLYTVAYYIERSLNRWQKMAAKLDIVRQNPDKGKCDPPELNADWKNTGGYSFASYSGRKILYSGDAVRLSVVGNGLSRVRLAALGLWRLAPCQAEAAA